jgi:hypothetical protein
MAAPPASTKTSLGQRLNAHARAHWPALARVQLRFRGQFAYVDGQLPDGQVLPLFRLRYGGSASRWGFALYRASHDDYLPSGTPPAAPRRPSTAPAASTSATPPSGSSRIHR